MTTRERLERAAARREDWAAKAAARSSAAMETARSITEYIPLGQPILVGHHSEAGHRRALARSAAAMDKGVAEFQKAEHHQQKAEAITRRLDSCIFDDDEDAAEKIAAKIATLEKLQKKMVDANKICRSKSKPEAVKLAELEALGLTPANATALLHPRESWQSVGFAPYALQNNSANIRRYRERLESIQRRAALVERAESAAAGVVIDYFCDGRIARVTFAEKPDREILTALKAAGYRWQKCCWSGEAAKLPQSVKELAATAEGQEDLF